MMTEGYKTGSIQTYEDCCRALAGDDNSRDTAALMGYVRSRLIGMEKNIGQAGDHAGLVEFSPSGIAGCRYDALSHVLLQCNEAMDGLAERLREKIVRENERMPVYRAREIDSAGMSWICRQPGRTIREKLSATGSVLAVRRRMSLDTGENRLLVAFANTAERYARLKLEYVGRAEAGAELDFLSSLARLRAVDGLEEIGRWENMPPNNTLLSDRYYRQIWNAWNELNRLDDLIAKDHEQLESRAMVILSTDILVQLKKSIRFPQVSIWVDYDAFSVGNAPFGGWELEGLDARSKSLRFTASGADVEICYMDTQLAVRARNGLFELSVTMQGMDPEITPYPIAPEVFQQIAFEVTRVLQISVPVRPDERQTTGRCRQAVLSVAEPVPAVVRDGAAMERLPGLVAAQRQKDGRLLSLADAQAAYLDEAGTICTVRSVLKSANKTQALCLAELIRGKIDAQQLVCLVPDAYDEFELGAMRKALRARYKQLAVFPESIAAAFSLLKNGQWDRQLRDGGFVVVVKLEADRLSMTLLQAVPESKLAQQGGIVWERYPTQVYSCAEKLSALCRKLDECGLLGRAEELVNAFGADGLPMALQRIALHCGKNWFSEWNTVSQTVREFCLYIDGRLKEFVKDYASVLSGQRPRTILLTPSLLQTASGAVFCGQRDLFSGYKNYCALSEQTELPLWRDHLPRLAIKRFIGTFDLVGEDAAVLPIRDRVLQINVKNTFILPAGKQRYRFQLMQGGAYRQNAAAQNAFAAVVENKAFPLWTDTECRLRLRYTYGSDEPYELFFEPLEPERAGFRTAGVRWEPMEEFAWKEMPSPAFPQRPSWEELEGDIDALAERFTRMSADLCLPRECVRLTVKADGWKETDNDPRWKHRYQICRDVSLHGELVDVYLDERQFDDWQDTRRDLDEIHCCLEDNTNKKFITASLSDSGVKWFTDKNGQLLCILRLIIEGEKTLVTISESRFLDESWRSEPDTVSFIPGPLEPYSGRSSAIAHYNGVRLSGEAIFVPVTLPGMEEMEVPFYKNRFLFPNEDFPPQQGVKLTFSWKSGKAGKINISNIAVGEIKRCQGKQIRAGGVRKQYTAKYILTDDAMSFGPLSQARLLGPLHRIFADGLTLTEFSCPDKLRECSQRLTRFCLKSFPQCADGRPKQDMFTILSLLAANIGEDYFDIAAGQIERWKTKGYVNDAVGYALGDLSFPFQRKFLSHIEEALREEDVLCILSRAAWKNSKFIFAMERESVLKHFASAVTMLRSSDRYNRYKRMRFLEFVLAVFRLRSLGEEQTDWALSLNNKAVRTLYAYLEEQIGEVRADRKDRRDFFSLLDIRIMRRPEYEDIPPILFALVGYVTGETGENDILISGVDIDGEEERVEV